MYLADYHTHSNLSFDGTDSLFEMVKAAEERGLSELCVTDHFDLTWDKSEEHLIDIAMAKKIYLETLREYNGNVKLKFGLELGQATQDIKLAKKTIEKTGYDFIIGSLHNCDKMQDFYYLDYKSIDNIAILKKYFEELKRQIELGFFDVLGHITYFLRYSVKMGVEIDFKPLMGDFADVFKMLIVSGRGIEVNTNAKNKDVRFIGKYRETSPDFELVKLYRSLGGEIITIGSDAHKADDIGIGIIEAAEMIRDAGFRVITCYKDRKPYFVDI